VFQTGLALPADRYKTAEQTARFFRPLLLRLKALPGVVDAAASSATPPYSGGQSKMEIAGKTHEEEWQSLFHPVSEEYFRVLRIEFRQGRGFSEAEVNDARKVAVVNETFARKYLPNKNPVGRRVHLASLDAFADPLRDKWFEIIGVVDDVANGRNRGLQVGLILVTLGVYSVLAYSTSQKTHEIGTRMALGAEAADARRLVVRSGLRLVVAGAIGIPLSLVLGRVSGTQLVGVTVYDPPTLAATTLLLTMTAAIACWIPARRAARVDPMVALRYE